MDDSFSNCSTKFTQTHRFIQGEDDSDSEEGHFSPFSNPNLKVYSSESRVQSLETKGTLGQGAVVQGGQILAALRRSKQKRSTDAQEAGVHR